MKILSAMKMSYPSFSSMQSVKSFNRVDLSQKPDSVNFGKTAKATSPTEINSTEKIPIEKEAEMAEEEAQKALNRAKEMEGEFAELEKEIDSLKKEAKKLAEDTIPKAKDLAATVLEKYKTLKEGGSIEGVELTPDEYDSDFSYLTEYDTDGNVVRKSSFFQESPDGNPSIMEIHEFKDGKENKYSFTSNNLIDLFELGIERTENGRKVAQAVYLNSIFCNRVNLYEKDISVEYSNNESQKAAIHLNLIPTATRLGLGLITTSYAEFYKNLETLPDRTKKAEVAINNEHEYRKDCTIFPNGKEKGSECLTRDGKYVQNHTENLSYWGTIKQFDTADKYLEFNNDYSRVQVYKTGFEGESYKTYLNNCDDEVAFFINNNGAVAVKEMNGEWIPCRQNKF